jgi:hypothetical protein
VRLGSPAESLQFPRGLLPDYVAGRVEVLNRLGDPLFRGRRVGNRQLVRQVRHARPAARTQGERGRLPDGRVVALGVLPQLIQSGRAEEVGLGGPLFRRVRHPVEVLDRAAEIDMVEQGDAVHWGEGHPGQGERDLAEVGEQVAGDHRPLPRHLRTQLQCRLKPDRVDAGEVPAPIGSADAQLEHDPVALGLLPGEAEVAVLARPRLADHGIGPAGEGVAVALVAGHLQARRPGVAVARPGPGAGVPLRLAAGNQGAGEPAGVVFEQLDDRGAGRVRRGDRAVSNLTRGRYFAEREAGPRGPGRGEPARDRSARRQRAVTEPGAGGEWGRQGGDEGREQEATGHVGSPIIAPPPRSSRAVPSPPACRPPAGP